MSTREDDVSRRVERLESLLNRVRSNAALFAQQRSSGAAARPSATTSPHDERDIRVTSRPAGLAPRAAHTPGQPSSASPSARASSPVSFKPPRSAEMPDVELESIPPSDSAELPSVEQTNTDWLGATTDAAYEPDALRQADSHRTLAETPAAKSGESARAPEAESRAEVEELDLPELESDPSQALSDVPPPAIGAVVNLDEGRRLPLELAEHEDAVPAKALTPSDPGDSVEPDEEGLEAELPRNSYTGFDSSLSAPPSAREELAAHDLAGRRRFSSVPVSEQTFEAPDDLPPVLSNPPTGGVPSVPGATRQTQIIGSHTAATDTAATDTAATDTAAFALEQQPALNAQPAVFEGAPIRPEAPTFLELLDRSLNLSVRR